MSKTSINQCFIDSLMASMEKMMDEKFAELKNKRLANWRRKIRSSDNCKPNQDQKEYNRARPRKEHELTPKPPDHTLRSIWSSSLKIPHSTQSKAVLYSEILSTKELYKFSGKGNYLEWERHMDDWFYNNHIPAEKRLTHAVSQLAGDAYKWWCKEVDDHWYFKEPTITSWRELKKLLRNEYASQAQNLAVQVNAKTQAFVEKRAALVPDQNKTTSPREAKPQSYLVEKLAKHVNDKKVETEARHYHLEKLTKCVNQEKLEAKRTSQPKEVNAQVVVHKQLQKPSLEPSNEQKQCESSKLSKSREVNCYNCGEKGHLAETFPGKKELAITSLESTPWSSNSSTEIVHQGLENSSSCVMHLVLSKVVDSGDMMENQKAEASGEHNALEKLPIGIILPLTLRQKPRGTYLESKKRMKPNLLSLDTCQTILRTTLFEKKDYNDARISTKIESSAQVVTQQANRENCIENNFDVGALRGSYLFNLKELGNKIKCSGNLTPQSIFPNWNHHNATSYQKVMNFSNWLYLNVADQDICALQGAFCSNRKDSVDDPTCYRFLTLQGTTPNWFQSKINFELKDIDSTTQTILHMPSFGLPTNRLLQTYIWRPGEFSKKFIYVFKVYFISENTDMIRLSLSKGLNAGYRVPVKRTRPIYEREEDDHFKQPDFDHEKHQLIKYFLLINEESPVSNFKPKPDKFTCGVRLLIYDCFASDIFSFAHAGPDLRTNPFQEGGDDTILARDELVDGPATEAELEGKINTKLVEGPAAEEELEDGPAADDELEAELFTRELDKEDDLVIPTEPMTRSITKKLVGILQHTLWRIEEQFRNLSLRNVTTTISDHTSSSESILRVSVNLLYSFSFKTEVYPTLGLLGFGF